MSSSTQATTNVRVEPTSESEAAAPLERLFRAIIFDWDGTAVANRHESGASVANLAEMLLRQNVWLVVVTGASFANIDRQFCQLVSPSARHHLLACTNRGSEVYGFDRDGNPVQRWQRIATPEEERALSAAAESVRDAIVAESGLEIDIVYNRLNRRKVDLIPLPEWVDPSKESIGELLRAVEERLHGAGFSGGLRDAFCLAERIADEHGLDARITTDVKYIDIGLTDTDDSVAWVKREVLEPEGISPAETLIVGDDFGSVAGFAGSDDRLRVTMDEAVVVSVGTEPTGVPDGVLRLGGGPVQFRSLLADQFCLHQQALNPAMFQARQQSWARSALAPLIDPAWRMDVLGYHPALEHNIESRFAIGNGFLGTRGSLGQATTASHPRTFVSGLFDTRTGNPHVPALVPAPDWLRHRLLLDGRQPQLESGEVLTSRRTLDLRRGLLLSEWRHCDPNGRSARMRSLRFTSLINRMISVQVAQFHVAQPASLSLEAWSEPPVSGLVLDKQTPILSTWQTSHTGLRLAIASVASLQLDSKTVQPVITTEPMGQCWQWTIQPGEPATFTRIVAALRESREDRLTDRARAVLRKAHRMGAEQLLMEHEKAWAERWAASDIEIRGDFDAQMAARFAMYHLISAGNPDDEYSSIGARALTGEAYLGHVFWDTDIFVLPFFTFTWPAAARALLMYRFHTLPAARAKAERLGYRGAFYAWESAHTGEESTPPFVVRPDGQVVRVRCGTDEQHISADIAYAIWQYWQVTGDHAFMRDAGAEILLETARFWASRAMLEADGRYHIPGVIGPDEYHEGVDDNAFTNCMAKWNIERGLDITSTLKRRWPARWDVLCEQLGITDEELTHWSAVVEHLYTGWPTENGLIEQFAGFFGLESIDLARYTPRTMPMDMLLGSERIQHSQVIKQADVVMLLALLWDHFPPEVREASFRYYEPCCAHGSSLSPPMHALVAARLGDTALAERYFRQTAAIDMDDMAGNAALGIHIAALGGLWQAIAFGFAGLSLCSDGLRFDPHLPDKWRSLRIPLQWRGRSIDVTVQRDPLTVSASLRHGKSLAIHLGSASRRLRAGQTWVCRWDDSDRHWREVSA